MSGARIEEKLFQNRYLVDAGRPHIKVRAHAVPSPALRALVHACPANCYSETDTGAVEVATDGCMECGTCRVLTQATGEIEWSYPRGGFGVLYKFG
ncbi:ferredoxin family protein [Roseomonas sp. NAR14]|uniref:Ferredoxin-like protein n=1 Tax=Roseomonas acroporae TaxID=2937791 RepID=A0A9X1Y7M7_9PROT|nr:ferredoxin family protein [Roseomonas acroporae]MCK8785001.1 ferredoxin family protein [Roseomonas acroporae]